MTETPELKPIKRKVKVTAEYEVDITILPKFFGPMTMEQYIEEFRRTLWEIDSIDDVAMYAAREAALYGRGQYDGLGDLVPSYSCDAKIADVIYDIAREEVESEIIEQNT